MHHFMLIWAHMAPIHSFSWDQMSFPSFRSTYLDFDSYPFHRVQESSAAQTLASARHLSAVNRSNVDESVYGNDSTSTPLTSTVATSLTNQWWFICRNKKRRVVNSWKDFEDFAVCSGTTMCSPIDVRAADDQAVGAQLLLTEIEHCACACCNRIDFFTCL